jgi:hypothetical protein
VEKSRPDRRHIFAACVKAGIADYGSHMRPPRGQRERALTQGASYVGGELLDRYECRHAPMMRSLPTTRDGNNDFPTSPSFLALCVAVEEEAARTCLTNDLVRVRGARG